MRCVTCDVGLFSVNDERIKDGKGLGGRLNQCFLQLTENIQQPTQQA